MDILFLAHRSPWPPDRGDRIRSWHVLRHLAGRARVHLVCLDEEAGAPAPELAGLVASCTKVRRTKSRGRAVAEALATGAPVSVAAWSDPDARAAVADVLARQRIDAIYAFSSQMAQYMPRSGPTIVMDFVDVDSAKFAALASTGPWPVRWLLAREGRKLAAFERTVAARVDASLFVTDAEAALFRAQGGAGRIATIENGVDTGYYDLAKVAALDGGGPTIVFTGQMDYAPNVDAVVGFVRDVLPVVRDRHPAIAFAIVGRAPTAAVRALAGDHVIVTGEVADTRPWIAGASVCVAPLAIGRGVQNKVLEAMAMARPVVASPAAAVGIDHGGAIRVADGMVATAETIGALLDDPGEAAMLGARARARVIHRYGWDARLAPLDALLGLAPMAVVA